MWTSFIMIALNDIDALKARFLNDINNAPNTDALNDIRVSALGKKGEISALMKSLGKMSPEDRKTFGAAFNIAKTELSDAIDAKNIVLAEEALNARLETEITDITLNVRPEPKGSIHPVSKVTEEVTNILGKIGFSVAEGPEIESEDYNFTKLNIPEDHPARQMHDTFYFSENEDGSRALLRTHTSPVQIRTMMQENHLFVSWPPEKPIAVTVI